MGDYVTKDEMRAHLNMQPSYVEDDAQVEEAIAAAESMVNDHTGRKFTAQASSARIFPIGIPYVVDIDDVQDPDEAITVEYSTDYSSWATLSSSSYVLEAPDPDWPATRLVFTSWPGRGWLRVTATWGWAAVPESVQQASKLIAAMLLSRRNSPNGIEAYGDFGIVRASRYVDGHAELLLKRYIRAADKAGIA